MGKHFGFMFFAPLTSNFSLKSSLLKRPSSPRCYLGVLPGLSLALFQVLCIPFVPLRTPSPHLPLLHVGTSWSRTHSCHAACQYAINPATSIFPWGFLEPSEFLPLSLTAAPGSHLSVSLHSESTKARGLSYSPHGIHGSRSHKKLGGASKCK